MHQIKLLGTINSDHKLSADVPPDLPAGPAEIIILVPDVEKRTPPDDLDSFLEWLDQQPRYTRSKEELDQYLAAGRESWERS